MLVILLSKGDISLTSTLLGISALHKSQEDLFCEVFLLLVFTIYTILLGAYLSHRILRTVLGRYFHCFITEEAEAVVGETMASATAHTPRVVGPELPLLPLVTSVSLSS